MGKKIGKLANRYALALLGACEEELGKDGVPTPAQKVGTELEALAVVWRENRFLSSSITSPMFPLKERTQALAALAKEAGLSKQAARFLELLLERGRIGAFTEIVEAFSTQADKAAEVLRVEVTTARVIPLEEAKDIEGSIKSTLGGRPEFDWKVEPELVGGLVVKYGGKILDGSIKGKLDRIGRELL